MNRSLKAAVFATVLTAIGALLLFTQAPLALAAIGDLVVMLLIGAIHDLGADGLGKWVNGFFFPSASGKTLAILIFWMMFFGLTLACLPKRRKVER